MRDAELKERVIAEGLEGYPADNCDAWALQPDGSWTRVTPRRGAHRHSAQSQLLDRLRERARDFSWS